MPQSLRTVLKNQQWLWVMTGDELAERLKELGLKSRDFARLIEVHENTVANWLHGRQAVPGPVKRLMKAWRLLYRANKMALE